jgi:GxxExxY protein
MPVTVHAEIRRIGQDEFARLAYNVMGHVFSIHAEFGRFLREEIYHCEIARRTGGRSEVPIEVRHADFRKFYYIDLLVGGSAMFELKTAQRLGPHHRAQLLQYLLLSDLAHGKLVNLQPESVQHEFVNTTLTLADRRQFVVDVANWDDSEAGSRKLRHAVLGLLADCGTCLSVSLYEEALVYLLGGEQNVLHDVEILHEQTILGTQPVLLAEHAVAFRVTAASSRNQERTAEHLGRFLAHTNLRAVQWINIRQGAVTLRTIHRA